nr:hypothetical protein [Tanacetum cinerariifolium]
MISMVVIRRACVSGTVIRDVLVLIGSGAGRGIKEKSGGSIDVLDKANDTTHVTSVTPSTMDGPIVSRSGDHMVDENVKQTPSNSTDNLNKGRSSYARVMIELRADVKLKDNIVMAMPKITTEGHYTCNVHVEYEWKPPRCSSCKVFGHIHDECLKNTGAGEKKTVKKPSQASRGVPVCPKIDFKSQKEYRPVTKKHNTSSSGNKKKGVEPTIKVSNSNPFDVLNSVNNDVEFSTNGGTSNLGNNEATPSGSSFMNIDNDVELAGNTSIGYGTNTLLEQWRDSYPDNDDYDPYDDDMYENHDLSEHLHSICNDLDITPKGSEVGKGVKEKRSNGSYLEVVNEGVVPSVNVIFGNTHVEIMGQLSSGPSDRDVEKEKLYSLVDTTVMGYFPPLPMHVTNSAGNDPGKSSYANVTGKPRGKKLNIHTLFTLEIWVKLHGVPIMTFSEDSLSAIVTKFGTPLRLDFYTSDMCMQSWGRSSYARVTIELRTDVELKDNIVECPKNTCAGKKKTVKKPTQTSRGVSVGLKIGFKPQKEYRPVSKKPTANSSSNKKKGVEPTIEVSNSNPFKVLNLSDNDEELGTNEGTTNLVNNRDTSSGSSFMNVDNSSSGTTPIIAKIAKFEELLPSGEDEVASVDNYMARSMDSVWVAFGTQSLLEQWGDSYDNGDYDDDPYDDDMSSYARVTIELRTDVELKDNIVVAMPKITREGHYICNVRVDYEWDTSSGSSFMNVDNSSSGTTPIIAKIAKFEELLPSGEDEVASVDNYMARSMDSVWVAFGTQSLLEQWGDSYDNGDYDDDPYDDDMYEVLTLITTRMAKEKNISKVMDLISLSFKKIYKPTNNNLRTSSNTSRANQVNTLKINIGTGYDNQREVKVDGARENVGYQHMAQIQEVTPDAVNNSRPIFDVDPLQKVQNDDDKYNVFANDKEHPEQPKSVNVTYLKEHGDPNITTDSLDMRNNGGEAITTRIFHQCNYPSIKLDALVMSSPNHPTFDIKDAFSSTHSPDYFPASPENTSHDPSDDLSKYLLASLAISPFYDDLYMKVMHEYDAIILPQVSYSTANYCASISNVITNI